MKTHNKFSLRKSENEKYKKRIAELIKKTDNNSAVVNTIYFMKIESGKK